MDDLYCGPEGPYEEELEERDDLLRVLRMLLTHAREAQNLYGVDGSGVIAEAEDALSRWNL